jgi:hypothetical protein
MLQNFTVEDRSGKRSWSCDIKGAVCCGYTGRNQDAVKKHIEELAKAGIKPPPTVPTFYPKPPAGVDLEGRIFTEGMETSGEIEYVLLVDQGDIWIGLGSDHTDRELERLDILKSKQACPAPMARTLWKYGEIKGHWDKIEMRSWVARAGEKVLYQQLTLATILAPEDLIRLVQQQVTGSIEGLAIFSGTSAILTEEMVFTDRFDGELYDPIMNRRINLSYTVHTLDWFRR